MSNLQLFALLMFVDGLWFAEVWRAIFKRRWAEAAFIAIPVFSLSIIGSLFAITKL